MSEDVNPFRVTLKGQGQNDPWLTVEGTNSEQLMDNLSGVIGDELDPDMTLTEAIAKAAAVFIAALNAQEGISIQRDRPAQAPAPQAPAPQGGARQAPPLSSGLQPESDGNYWINLPYNRDKTVGGRQRDWAKSLGARFKPDEAPDSIPRNGKGVPERPWCVHSRYVTEENVQALLAAHASGFAGI